MLSNRSYLSVKVPSAIQLNLKLKTLVHLKYALSKLKDGKQINILIFISIHPISFFIWSIHFRGFPIFLMTSAVDGTFGATGGVTPLYAGSVPTEVRLLLRSIGDFPRDKIPQLIDSMYF